MHSVRWDETNKRFEPPFQWLIGHWMRLSVRHHAVAVSERANQKINNAASSHLRLAEKAALELEEILRTKPGSSPFVPSLCLDSWGDPRPRCLHPLFDRLRWNEPDLGGPDPLPALLPVNFLDMPERLRSLGDVFECLRRCEDFLQPFDDTR